MEWRTGRYSYKSKRYKRQNGICHNMCKNWKTDVIYKKYLKRALIGYCRPELKLERAKELNKILFEDKEKINKKNRTIK